MAEGGGLLNRYTVNIRIVGSNPIPSATYPHKSWLFGRSGQLSTTVPTAVRTPRVSGRGRSALAAQLTRRNRRL